MTLHTLAVDSQIIESKNLADLFFYITPENAAKTLLLLDIDLTLIRSPQYLGSDLWFEYFVDHLQKNKKMSVGEAYKNALRLFYLINKVSDAIIVHPNTVKVLTKLQEMGVTIIGLTARLKQCARLTKNQLATAGLDFLFSPHKRIKSFIIDRKHQAAYRNGIIYCGMMSKNEALDLAMTHQHLHDLRLDQINKIFFADDKRKNVVCISQTLKREKPCYNSVEQYIGLRYGHADHLVVKSRNRTARQIATVQMKVFLKHGFLISDLQAQSKANHFPKPILHSYQLRKRRHANQNQTTTHHPTLPKFRPYLRLI